jgi:hypothetical protein
MIAADLTSIKLSILPGGAMAAPNPDERAPTQTNSERPVEAGGARTADRRSGAYTSSPAPLRV